MAAGPGSADQEGSRQQASVDARITAAAAFAAEGLRHPQVSGTEGPGSRSPVSDGESKDDNRQQTDRVKGEADSDRPRPDQADEAGCGGQAEKHPERPGEAGQCKALDPETPPPVCTANPSGTGMAQQARQLGWRISSGELRPIAPPRA